MTESDKEKFDPFGPEETSTKLFSVPVEKKLVSDGFGLSEKLLLRTADFNYEDGVYTYKKELKVNDDKKFVTLLDLYINLKVLIPTATTPSPPVSHSSITDGVVQDCRTYLELDIGGSKFHFQVDVSKIGCLADRNNGTRLTLVRCREQTCEWKKSSQLKVSFKHPNGKNIRIMSGSWQLWIAFKRTLRDII